MDRGAEKIILGIDPGSNVTGFGVIAVSGSKIRVLEMGVFKMPKSDDHFDKLKEIFRSTLAVIERCKPAEFAVEAPFYGNNVQSMLKLGRAQGVAISAALSMDLPVFEYSPRKVKQAITGNGAASKEQVAAMLKQMYGITIDAKYLDATDGLAVAVCHGFRNNLPGVEGKVNSWEAFLKKNPDRLK
jgi:crossover junction endodeoxyribonuclease RuvC